MTPATVPAGVRVLLGALPAAALVVVQDGRRTVTVNPRLSPAQRARVLRAALAVLDAPHPTGLPFAALFASDRVAWDDTP